MNLDQLLGDLGRHIGLADARLQDGVCRLVFDGATNVDFEETAAGGAFHMYTALGAMPHDPEEKRALYISLLRESSGGENATSVVPEESTVYLCRTESLTAIDVEAFLETIAAFVRQARICAAKLEQPDSYAMPSAKGGAEDEPLGNFIRV